MINIKVPIIILLTTYIMINSVHSGGFIDFRYGNAFMNNVSDKYVFSRFSSHSIASGVTPSAMLLFKGRAQIGESIPTLTDYKMNLTAKDAYYSRMASIMHYQSGEVGQDPINHTLNIDTLVIMPKKFDSFHSEVINITDDGKYANVKVNFTYDNIEYEFINQTDLSNETNALTLILQPFCEEFKGLDLDMDETFDEFASANGLDYHGDLTIQAMQN